MGAWALIVILGGLTGAHAAPERLAFNAAAPPASLLKLPRYALWNSTDALLTKLAHDHPALRWIVRGGPPAPGVTRWRDPRVAADAENDFVDFDLGASQGRFAPAGTARGLGTDHPLAKFDLGVIDHTAGRAVILEVLINHLIEADLGARSLPAREVFAGLVSRGAPPVDMDSPDYARFVVDHAAAYVRLIFRTDLRRFDAARALLDFWPELNFPVGEFRATVDGANAALGRATDDVHAMIKAVKVATEGDQLATEARATAVVVRSRLNQLLESISTERGHLYQLTCEIGLAANDVTSRAAQTYRRVEGLGRTLPAR